MLIRFRVQNFLSFREEVELSMVAGKVQKHPEHITQLARPIDLGLVRSAVIYGANASGKSNLIKAVDFAKFMITEGVRAKTSIPRKHFKLNPAYSSQPSRFEFEFLFQERIYAYGFAVDNKRIHKEWLHEIRPTTEKVIFDRTTTADDINIFEFGGKRRKKESNILEYLASTTPVNRLFLQECAGRAGDKDLEQLAAIQNWFDDALVIIYPQSLHSLAGISFGNAANFGNFLVNQLSRFGTGICGYSLQPVSDPLNEFPKAILEGIEQSLKDNKNSTIINPDGQRYFIQKENDEIKVQKLLLEHRDQSCNSDVFFEMDEESDGTLRLLDLLPLFYPQKEGYHSVIFIDEIDRSLHPNLSYEFIAAFLQQKNRKQIIVTTHESNLLDLDLFRRDEIWFTEKNQQGASSLYSLEEFAPRYDKDIQKGYILGRFGAIPMISASKFSSEE